ncbi:hypothetical protein IFM89_026499 [Coptis chinensis]|uniref:Stress-response A/B barrel domain-containing protein n=1 Tax=Coptis chinensis TaxID=261450 RepID=A0A835M6Q1_9MAGN|nr:hypothetical protein IFM89_026499 [Coptis chinensis]
MKTATFKRASNHCVLLVCENTFALRCVWEKVNGPHGHSGVVRASVSEDNARDRIAMPHTYHSDGMVVLTDLQKEKDAEEASLDDIIKQLENDKESSVLEENELRSLFERLSSMECSKHLLDMHYRMHPKISCFPNSKFYQEKVLDAPNVKSRSYEKHYLPILEEKKLMMLVAAIQEKFGKMYQNIEDFDVRVKYVDGFQGEMVEATGLVKHVLMAKFKDVITPDQVDQLIKGYGNLVTLIEPMKSFHWYISISLVNLLAGICS